MFHYFIEKLTYARVFILMLLFSQVKLKSMENPAEAAYDSLTSFFDNKIETDPASHAYFMDEAYTMPLREWRDINAEFFRSRFETQTVQSERLISSILSIRKLSPFHENIIDITLNYSPDFRITFLRPGDSVQSLEASSPAAYLPSEKELYIKVEYMNNPGFETMLLHEFVHAYADVLQKTLHGFQLFSPQPYYPSKDRALYLSYLKKGDLRVSQFLKNVHALHLKHQRNALSKEEENAYKEKLAIIDSLNRDPYRLNIFSPVKTKSLVEPQMEAILKQAEGNVVNLDFILETKLGDIFVEKIDSRETLWTVSYFPVGNSTRILSDIDSKLNQHIIDSFMKDPDRIETGFIPEKQAYLYQLLPLNCLNAFYPEMLHYDKELSEKLLEKALPNSIYDNPLLRDLGKSAYLLSYGAEKYIDQLDQITQENAIGYFMSAQSLFYIHKKAEEAERICDSLVKNGFFKSECYEKLAQTAMRRQHYHQAYRYYTHAERKGKLHTENALYHYALSAVESGHINKAKQLIKAYKTKKSNIFKAEMESLESVINRQQSHESKHEL